MSAVYGVGVCGHCPISSSGYLTLLGICVAHDSRYIYGGVKHRIELYKVSKVYLVYEMDGGWPKWQGRKNEMLFFRLLCVYAVPQCTKM